MQQKSSSDLWAWMMMTILRFLKLSSSRFAVPPPYWNLQILSTWNSTLRKHRYTPSSLLWHAFWCRVCWGWMSLQYSFVAGSMILIMLNLLSVLLQIHMPKKLARIHLKYLWMRNSFFLVLQKKATMDPHGTLLPPIFRNFWTFSSLLV